MAFFLPIHQVKNGHMKKGKWPGKYPLQRAPGKLFSCGLSMSILFPALPAMFNICIRC